MNERKVAVVFLPSLESSSSRRRKKRPTSSTVWRRRRGRVKSRQAINQQTAAAAAALAACLVVAEKKSFDTTRITFLNVRLLSARSEPLVAWPGLAAARLVAAARRGTYTEETDVASLPYFTNKRAAEPRPFVRLLFFTMS